MCFWRLGVQLCQREHLRAAENFSACKRAVPHSFREDNSQTLASVGFFSGLDREELIHHRLAAGVPAFKLPERSQFVNWTECWPALVFSRPAHLFKVGIGGAGFQC